MKTTFKIIPVLAVAALCSCTKNIDKELPGNERSLLELKIKGQMGVAEIVRTDSEASVNIYIMENDEYPFGAAEVEGIVVSVGATASVGAGQTLNFSNPERKTTITVTSGSGESLAWNVYLKIYDAFYVGEWVINNVRVHCDQTVSGAGNGAWETQITGSEFGYIPAIPDPPTPVVPSFGQPEMDNRITITMDDGEVTNNQLTGTITNAAGADDKYGHFWIVGGGPYTHETPYDMDHRFRHLLPPGTAKWTLNLATGEMKITKDNITSTMSFGTIYGNRTFHFALPKVEESLSGVGIYDNMYLSSTALSYEVAKVMD